MEIRNLNTFLKVAALKNFTQASRELGYSQSNVSAQIQQIEREVGTSLFNRIGRSVSLTQYGEELIPYARQIVSTALQMENFLKSAESLGGTVKIGLVESLFDLITEDMIIEYHRKYPHVNIEFTVDATELLKEALAEGKLDAACLIDHPLSKTEWNCCYSINVPIIIVCNPNHFLSNKEHIELAELAEQEFVLMEGTAPYIVQFQQIMANHELECHSFLKLQSSSMARKLVEKGEFLSVLPRYSVQNAINTGALYELELPEVSLVQSVQIIAHVNKLITPQIEGFVEALKKTIGNIDGCNQKL